MKKKNNKGYTLLEMMIAVAIFTMVMGTLYTLSFTMGRTQRVQDAKFQTAQQIRQAIATLIPLLQQASRQTIVINADGDGFTFRMPEDTDGNGVAVDVSGNMEISGVYTVAVNGSNQLTLTDPTNAVTILANNINPGRELGSGDDFAFTSDDDANGNGRQDMGFNLTRIGTTFLLHIGTVVQTTDRGPDGTPFDAVSNVRQVVFPRNR